MKLDEICEKRVRLVVGLVSGNSCSGIDAALVRVQGTGRGQKLQLGRFKTFPYASGFRTRLLSPRFNEREICLLNFDLGQRFAEAALDMVERAREQDREVDLVASRGHTIAHVPPRAGEPCGTLQLGESAIIAERTGLPVISDFHTRDMAAGGQGGPLIPYATWLLFARKDRTVACLNIGGIASFTVVPTELEDVIAFDTGPGTMAIDAAVRFLSRGTKEIDESGATAARGKVIDEFFDHLLDHPFFRKVPPKSTGREDFGAEVYLRDALNSRRDHSFEDLIATITAATAESIVRAYNRFIKPQYNIARLIVSGGAVDNRTLMTLIKDALPDAHLRTSDQYGIPHAAHKAIAFAVLGNEALAGNPANVPNATGARHPVILGKITPS